MPPAGQPLCAALDAAVRRELGLLPAGGPGPCKPHSGHLYFPSPAPDMGSDTFVCPDRLQIPLPLTLTRWAKPKQWQPLRCLSKGPSAALNAGQGLQACQPPATSFLPVCQQSRLRKQDLDHDTAATFTGLNQTHSTLGTSGTSSPLDQLVRFPLPLHSSRPCSILSLSSVSALSQRALCLLGSSS